ncbi:MAG: OmpA family protein [Pseudomonadota bacterium]
MKIKNAAVAGAVALSLGFAVQSQANEGAYVGGSLTGYYLDSSRFVGGAKDSVVGGLNLGYRFANDWALEIGGGSDVDGEDLETAKLDMYYWLGEADPDSTAWRPYWVAGISYFDLDDQPRTPEAFDLGGEDEHTWQAGLGLGLSKMFTDHLEFRSDVRALYKVRDDKNNAVDGALNLAVNYYFNGPKPAPVVQAAPAPAPAPQPVAAPPAPEPEKRTITVKLKVEFEFDKAVVRNIYGDELEAVANAMKAHEDIDLVLEGHTDSIGTEAYNQGLSERRVQAVKAKLVQDYGIPADRISTVGYGESRPIADNSTAEGRQRNRRVIGELSYVEVMPE